MTTPSDRADIANIRVGDSATCEVLFDRQAIADFARLSGDDNPLHMDADVAGEYGFNRPVAHGLLTMAIISRLIGTKLPGPGSLWVGQDIRFTAPVFEGDTILGRVQVERVSAGTGMVVLETEAINPLSQIVVMKGRAQVRVPPRRDKRDRLL